MTLTSVFVTTGLHAIALLMILGGAFGGFTISHFACNNTWNPRVKCNSRIPLLDICNLKLHLGRVIVDSSNSSGGETSSPGAQSVKLQFLVTSGAETLRGSSVQGVDYWIASSATFTVNNDNLKNEVSLKDYVVTLPNICGQSYLIARIIEDNLDTVAVSTPLQLDCPEEHVDLALVGETGEDYNVYSRKPVLHATGQPLSYYIPKFKLSVRNTLENTTFSARTGLSTYRVVGYLKPQLWYMFDWKVGNASDSTVAHVDIDLLDFQLGNVMLQKGNRLVEDNGGRGTAALAGGHQTDLRLENLVLTSKAVCGNAVMIFQLTVIGQPKETNRINNFYILPVFVDCWGHNPVQQIETCEVTPNYYDGGQTAWITYTVPGETKIYEYKSDERSIRAMNADVDGPFLKDVVKMKLTTEIQSDRLLRLGQCVDTLWGRSDSFVTSADVLLTSLRKHLEEVQTKSEIQKKEVSKISIILSTISDLLTLALQPQNPLHTWLFVPFQYILNPLLPRNVRGDKDMFYEETNRVSRRRRQAVDTNPSNLLPDLISPSVTGKTDSTVQITSVPSASSAWSSSTSQVKVHTGVTLEKTTPTKESLYATSEMTHKAESVTVVATELPSPPSIASRSIEASPSNLGNTNSEPTVTAGIPPVTLVSSTVDHHPSSSDVSSFKMTSASIIHNMTAAVTTSSQSQSSTPSLSNSSTPDSQTNYTVSDISLTNGENLRSTAGMPKILATVDTPTSSGSYTKSFTATSITSSDKMNTTGSTMTVMTKQMTSETTDIAGATTPTSGRTSPPSFSTSGLQGRGASTSSVFTAGVNETFTNSNPSSNGPMHTTNTPLHDAATTLSSGRESVSELSSSPPTYTTAKYTNHAATTVVSTGGRGSVSSHPSSTSIYTTTASFGSTSEGRSSSSPLPSGTSRAGMPITSTSSYSSSTINMHFDDSLSTRSAPSDDKYFGPKSEWHKAVMEYIYDIVKYSGKGLYVLSPQRWQAISSFMKTLLYGHRDDYERYSYIPKTIMDNVATVLKMAVGQNLPRIFDNIPEPIVEAVTSWMELKERQTADLGNSPCHFQEGFGLALNVTEELLNQKEWDHRKDQLELLAQFFQIGQKGDHADYLAELYSRFSSAKKLGRTWMVRDGIPIDEPDVEDVCKRYAAVKLWKLQMYPVFSFAGRIVSPDQYQSVFWTQDQGTILRGDRSELTGQVFWSKVATCSCPSGASCGSGHSALMNDKDYVTNATSTNIPGWSTSPEAKPMLAEPVKEFHIDETLDQTSDDESRSEDVSNRHKTQPEFEMAEDMMFGE